MREEVNSKKKEEIEKKFKAKEMQLKAKEYAKKQRDMISQKKSRGEKSTSTITKTVDDEENNSPNMGLGKNKSH